MTHERVIWGAAVPSVWGGLLLTLSVSVTVGFLQDRAVSPVPRLQPGERGNPPFWTLRYPLTCPVRGTLPEEYDPASIALTRVTETHRPLDHGTVVNRREDQAASNTCITYSTLDPGCDALTPSQGSLQHFRFFLEVTNTHFYI